MFNINQIITEINDNGGSAIVYILGNQYKAYLANRQKPAIYTSKYYPFTYLALYQQRTVKEGAVEFTPAVSNNPTNCSTISSSGEL